MRAAVSRRKEEGAELERLLLFWHRGRKEFVPWTSAEARRRSPGVYLRGLILRGYIEEFDETGLYARKADFFKITPAGIKALEEAGLWSRS